MRSAVVDLGSQPARNLFSDPGCRTTAGASMWQGSSGSITWSVESVIWSRSGKAIRATVTGGNSRETVGPALTNIGLTVGATYTVEWDIVLSESATTLEPIFGGGSSQGWTIVKSANPVAALPGVPVHLWITFTVGSGTDVRAMAFWNGKPANSWNEISNRILYEGPHRPGLVYGDGDTPGWRWWSTAQASQSSGYPYTLESIAGPPAHSLYAPGATGLVSVPAFGGRTLYTVFDVSNVTAGYEVPVVMSRTDNGSIIQVQTDAAGTNNMRVRIDTPGGSSNAATFRSGTRTVGRHVYCAQLDDGLGSARLMVDTTGESTLSVASGTGAPDMGLSMTPQAGIASVVAHAYGVAHNAETRRRIMAWLGRQYGAPVPAGY